MNKISFYSPEDIEKLRKETKLDPYYLTQWRNTFCKQSLGELAACAAIPNPIMAKRFREEIEYHHLTLVEKIDSQFDGATKLLFRTHDDHLVEAVILRIQSGRTSLCISSQAGCAVGCEFCATGKLGLARNLTTSEILDQVAQANQILFTENRKVRNIVFMGMGEPFHNYNNVKQALSILIDTKWFHISDKHITISTVGICDKILTWGADFPKMSFALSLHSARQEIRNQIIPFGKKYSLEQLKQVCQEITHNSSRYIMLEYLMLQGLTDTDEDLVALTNWCQDLPIHLNIIRYNNDDKETKFISSTPQRIQEFADKMRDKVLKVTFRCSLGSDIVAACGQLASKHAENKK